MDHNVLYEDDRYEDQEEAVSPHAEVMDTNAFVHPLIRYEDEIREWIRNEEQGASSAVLRAKYDAPCDTFTRASWRRQLATEHCVRQIDMKRKRRLYSLMRQPDVDEHTFLPFMGITVGQLCVFHILNKTCKDKRTLLNVVDAYYAERPLPQKLHRVSISLVPDPNTISGSLVQYLKYGPNQKAAHSPPEPKRRRR